MTLEGATIYVCLARSDFWGRRLPTQRPGWPPTDPGRGCQTLGALAWPPPVASPRSGNISCPRPHPQLPGGSELASQPGQRSQLPQLAFLLVRAGEGPVWLREAMGEPRRRAPGAERGRLGTPRFGQGRDQLAALWDPVAFPGVTCSLAGVSRSSRSLPALSPHAVAHAGFSAGPHAPEAAGVRLLHAAAPNGGVPGSTAPAARHRERLELPWGALCATPASPQTLRARGEGSGKARGARDSDRPESSPAGGVEGGGGHRRSYSGITPGTQLGPAP